MKYKSKPFAHMAIHIYNLKIQWQKQSVWL